MISPFPPGAALIGYLRDSGGLEQEASLEQQEHELRAWCAAHGHTLARIYRDEAISGSTSAARAAFLQMIEHFRNGASEAGVIVWKFSRFARSLDDAQFYRADLRRRGYLVHSLKDTIPPGPEGRFFEAAIDWMNERYRADLATDIRRGLRYLVHTHRCMTGTPPAGYRRRQIQIGAHRDGTPRLASQWEIDPETAPIVRQAFALRVSGATYQHIHEATHLHEFWRSYAYMLRNPIYTGALRLHDELVPGFTEPIIDQAAWDAVQAINDRNDAAWKHPRRKGSRFLLSGLARCGHCGEMLSGYTTRYKETRYSYYRCWRDDCQKPQFNVSKENLETAVLDAIRQHIARPGFAEQLHAEYQTYRAARRPDDRQAADIARIETQLARIVAAIKAAGHSPTLLAEMTALERQKANLQARSAAPALPDITPAALAAYLDHLQASLASAEEKQTRQALLGLVHDLRAWRENDRLHGHVELFMPMISASPENVICTPKLYLEFSAPIKRKS